MLALLVAQALQPKPIPPIDWNDLPYQKRLTEMADGWRAKYHIPGVWCALIVDGRVVACVANGYRNLETKALAGVKDHLNIGSVSKAITGTLIAELVAQGVITYETTLGETFPELAGKNPSCPLLHANLRQLLDHTAGLPKDGTAYGKDDKGGVDWRRGQVEEALKLRNAQEPGKSYSYSNIGPVVATAMVERAIKDKSLGRKLGSSFEDWYYGPLGHAIGITNPRMLDWSSRLSDDDVQPYLVYGVGDLRANLRQYPTALKFYTAGACSITLTDLCRFTLGTMDNAAGLPGNVYHQTVTVTSSVDPKGKADTPASWEGSLGCV